MSRLKKEISDTKTELDINVDKKNQPQRLTEDILDQVAGGWINAFGRWSRRF